MAELRPVKVFYSWQSEAYPKVCRNFIEECLKRAIKELNRDLKLDEAYREGQGVTEAQFVFDKDTRGVPGSPDIVEAILRKIGEADFFVGDLTVVRPGEGEQRPASNANVLVETGYALGRHGRDRVMLAFNIKFGKLPADLPFNLRQTSICAYDADPESTDLAGAKKALVAQFKERLEAVLPGIFPPPPEPPDPKIQIFTAIREQAKNRKKLFEAYFVNALEESAKLAVQGRTEPPDPAPFQSAVEAALGILQPVFEMLDAIAEQDDAEALQACTKGIRLLLKAIWEDGNYDHRTDLPKLLGYILYCYIAAAFIREEHFTTLAGFLEESYSVKLRGGEPHSFTYGEFSRDIRSLSGYDGGRWYSPVGTFMLRLCDEKKIPLSPAAYVEADTLLWLRSALGSQDAWFPRACYSLQNFEPDILLRARSKKVAAKVAPLLGLDSLDGAGQRILEAFAQLYNELGQMKGQAVGMYIYANKPERFASV